MSALARPTRAGYVPAPRTGATPNKKRPRIDRTLATKRARDVFRSVAWTGRASEAEPTRDRRAWLAGLAPTAKARAAFRNVKWTGENNSDNQTDVQNERSVTAVLSGFGWE